MTLGIIVFLYVLNYNYRLQVFSAIVRDEIEHCFTYPHVDIYFAVEAWRFNVLYLDCYFLILHTLITQMKTKVENLKCS